MRSIRKTIAVLAAAGSMSVAGFFAPSLIQNVQYAMAEQNVQDLRKGLAAIHGESDVFNEVARVVGPSVVNINVRKTVHASPSAFPFDDPRFRQFFHDFGGGGQNAPDEGRTYQERGTGSGVIMEAGNGTGYILTNNHVAGGATDITVTLSDGRVIKHAKVVGTDPRTDLAVVEVKAERLIPAHWGDSTKLQQGDRVMAFGSPFGYVGSMTHGIVSALHRQAGILGQYGYEDFIQTDAPINPGNSGGPLVDVHGNVMGINAAIASESGGFEGIGFAIPSGVAKQVYTVLKQHGHVVRGWIGAEIADVSKFPDEAKAVGFNGERGVLVKGTLASGPAAGHLQPGDVITGMNGKPINNTEALREAIAWTAPGTQIKLDVVRNGKPQTVEVKLGEQPGPRETAGAANQESHSPSYGMRLEDMTSNLAQRFGVHVDHGAAVTSVRPGSPAAAAGIKSGDVITRVGNQSVGSAEEAAAALSKADLKTGIGVIVQNREGSHYVFMQSQQ